MPYAKGGVSVIYFSASNIYRWDNGCRISFISSGDDYPKQSDKPQLPEKSYLQTNSQKFQDLN